MAQPTEMAPSERRGLTRESNDIAPPERRAQARESNDIAPPERRAQARESVHELVEHIFELSFEAQLGVLRTIAPRILRYLRVQERYGYLRDLNEEIRRAETEALTTTSARTFAADRTSADRREREPSP